MSWETDAILYLERNKDRKKITWKELEKITSKSKSTLWRNKNVRYKLLHVNGRLGKSSHKNNEEEINILRMNIDQLKSENNNLKSMISKLLFIIDQNNIDSIEIYEAALKQITVNSLEE